MKRLASVLLCSAGLAFATASPAEEPAGEPASETLEIPVDDSLCRIPVPIGFRRAVELEESAPPTLEVRRLAFLVPTGWERLIADGVPSTSIEILLVPHPADASVAELDFESNRRALLDRIIGQAEIDSLTLPPDDPHRPGCPWREIGERWCCAGCLVPPETLSLGNSLTVPASQAKGFVVGDNWLVLVGCLRIPSNEEEDAKLREEAVRYLREFVALNPVAKAENAVRTFSELVQRSDRDVKGNPLPTSNGEASESHGKTDAMIRAFVAFVGTVLGVLVLLKFRKMILCKYSRFDDFKWDGQSDFPKTKPEAGMWIEKLPDDAGLDESGSPRIELSPMRTKQDFYLLSLDDTIIHDPVKCTPIRFLRMGRRNDYLLCKVSPPIPGRCMGILKPGIETVVLVSRQSVGGLRRKLVGQHSVHVMRLLSKPGWLGLIRMKDVAPFSWSEVFPTKAEADHAKEMDAGLTFPSRYYFGIQKLALSVPLSWQFLAYGIKNDLMNLSEIPFYYMMLEKRNSTCPSDVEWKACHDANGVQSKEKTIAFLELNEAQEIESKGKEPLSTILERWIFVIFDWAHGLDFPAWHRLALADEIAEEFGWPEALSSFSRKEGFPPEDEARRMAAWQSWLAAERAKWKPKA